MMSFLHGKSYPNPLWRSSIIHEIPLGTRDKAVGSIDQATVGLPAVEPFEGVIEAFRGAALP
jgi:hypothetical protein